MPNSKKARAKQQEGFSSFTPKHFALNPERTTHLVEKLLTERRKAVFARFPLLFTLLTAFGFVATFYGFEGLMDQTGLSENPLVLLGLGMGILIFTGTLYKKLGD